MLKNFFFLSFSVFTLGCTSEKDNSSLTIDVDSLVTQNTNPYQILSPDARQWLIFSIEGYFNNQIPIENICSKEYFEFKNDAINVDIDGGITEEAFKKKWSPIRDLEFVGIGSGFLISGQDWRKIKVTKCHLLKEKENGDFVFEVTISDLDFNAQYDREITIGVHKNTFLIYDVKEFN